MILNADAFQKKQPTAITILTTAIVAFLDTTYRYGNKIFYIPRTKFSYTGMLNRWKRFLAYVSSAPEDSDDPRDGDAELQRMVEIMITMVMMKDAYGNFCEGYHINNRIFRQALSRWRSILTYWYPAVDKMSRAQWMDWMRGVISSHTWKKSWDRGDDPLLKMIREEEKDKKKKKILERECDFYGIHTKTWERVSHHVWYHWMSSSESPVLNMEETMYEDFDLFSYMSKIHLSSELWLPMPRAFRNHLVNKGWELEDAFSTLEQHREDRKSWTDYFSEHVMMEVENDVAYRPGMPKFLECQQHFESLQHKL
jgi:hypothetical protein